MFSNRGCCLSEVIKIRTDQRDILSLTRKLFNLRLPLTEVDDLLITLGLSSGKSDLRANGDKNFRIKMQRMELFESRMDGFCVFKP